MSETQQPAKRFADWRERHLHWGILRVLGNSRLVTSSIAWIFIVPIAAKLLAPFAGQHTLDLSWFDHDLNEPIAVTVALPFSWQRFYFMAWLFVIGQVVYWLACPEIVRKYANYAEYRRDHTGPVQLTVFLWRALLRRTAASKQIMAATGASGAEPRKTLAVFAAVLATLQLHPRHDPEGTDIKQNRVFDAVLSVERHARRLWFWVSGVFFGGGLALFVWVVVEGGVEVCKPL